MTRSVLPCASGCSVSMPHRLARRSLNAVHMVSVSREFSLSTITMRQGVAVSSVMESNKLARSSWRLYVTTTMASLSMGAGRVEGMGQYILSRAAGECCAEAIEYVLGTVLL